MIKLRLATDKKSQDVKIKNQGQADGFLHLPGILFPEWVPQGVKGL